VNPAARRMVVVRVDREGTVATARTTLTCVGARGD
jgi:hypothetical protein